MFQFSNQEVAALRSQIVTLKRGRGEHRDKLGIDLIEAANKKVDINKRKYPVDEVKGSARK